MHLPHSHKHQKKVAVAIAWGLLSCLASGVMVNMVKHISTDMHTAEVIFFRNVFAFLIFIPIIMYKGLAHFRTKRVGMHVLRSATGLISMMMYFYAISMMNLSVVTALSFTAPLFTAILAIYFFKDKPNFHQTFALFVGFIGVIIVARPDSEAFNPISLLVLLCTLFWALSGIIIKKLSETESATQTTFYMTFFMMIFTAPLVLYDWQQPTIEQYMWLVGIALTSNALQFSLAKSLSMADFSVLLPFDFTRLIFSAGIAYIVFGEEMDFNAVVGSIVILSSAFYAALNERRKIRKLTQLAQLNKAM
jgi:drug/metabolite transporter (DMT)-like permease